MSVPDLIAQAYAAHDAGNSPQALRLLDEALRAGPDHADLLFARGNVRRESGDAAGAETDFRAVLAARPAHVKAQNNLGAILLARGELPAAQAHFEAALQADAQFADAAFNLGVALHRQQRQAEALPWFENAAAWRAGFAAAELHLGRARADLGRLEEGAAAMRRAIAADPADAGPYNDLALLLTQMNRVDEAIAAHREALARRPDDDEFKTNFSLSLMQSADLAQAWDLYEHRWHADGRLREAYRYDPAAEWHGGSLAGKRLRVWWEQGLGDTLCFVRYLPLLAERYTPAAISLECQPGMGRLLRNSLPGVEVIEQGEAGSAFDLQVPLMSLPQRCGILANALPEPPLAFSPSPEALARWRAKVEALDAPRVGVVWASGVWATGVLPLRRQRTVVPEIFERLLQVPALSFISLQKGAGAADAQRWRGRPNFFDWTDEISDFDDTAALMSCLDLIITADTSVTHLAGALGQPTWVLLRYEGGNLWAAGAERTPWYPRMRVFRQARQADWDGPVDRAVTALREFAAAGGGA
ncbi:MAG TPA: tetratricopeptide repeat protein [Burkholderiales bacterium]|nr:tetratricopeptide repeat protein [Burkholderiales bacterium]